MLQCCNSLFGWQPDAWKINIGAGWESRAPTVTEAYGDFLNNTFGLYCHIVVIYQH